MALDGDQSIQRNERLLAVGPLSFGIGETNYSQGRVSLKSSFTIFAMNLLLNRNFLYLLVFLTYNSIVLISELL